MTKQEIDVVKKFLKEVLCQLDAEVLGETTIHGYTDTDSSNVYLTEEGYVTVTVKNKERIRFSPLPESYVHSFILNEICFALPTEVKQKYKAAIDKAATNICDELLLHVIIRG